MGWHVTGVDYNPELLERARESAATRGLEVAFLEQDMRELDVEGRPFDVVTCLFDSIGYGLEDEAIVKALRGMAKHLTPKGVLAVEFLHAAAVVRHHSPVKVRRFPTPGGGLILRISETELDRPNQLIHVSYELIELKQDGGGLRACDGDAVQPLLLPRGDARDDDPGKPRRARNRPRVRGRGGHLGRDLAPDRLRATGGTAPVMRVAVVLPERSPETGGGFTFQETLQQALSEAAPGAPHEFVYFQPASRGGRGAASDWGRPRKRPGARSGRFATSRTGCSASGWST